MLPLFIFQLNYQMARWSYLKIVCGEKQFMIYLSIVRLKGDIFTWAKGSLRRFLLSLHRSGKWANKRIKLVIKPVVPPSYELFPLDPWFTQFGRRIELDCHSVFYLWNSFCKCMCCINLNPILSRIILLINWIGAFHFQPVHFPNINILFLTSHCKLKGLCCLLFYWWRIE